MGRISEKIGEYLKVARTGMADDGRRMQLMFFILNIVLSFVSGFMTVVNIFTAKWLLMCSTLIFSVACILNILLMKLGFRKIARELFLTEALVLCGFFCLSGTPEGFSALWTCFIPSFTLALLGRKWGSLYSGLGLLMIVICFWTPFGRELLCYEYTNSFMLRFPMIYVAFYVVALFLESVRWETQRQLREAEQRYQYLYKHDALTGIYNRYGLNELMNQVYADHSTGRMSFLILDLDHFKVVNDTWGHDVGDDVLRLTADTLQRLIGEKAAVCRWGGEEFTVLLWGDQDAEALAERMRLEMEKSYVQVGEVQVHVTVSIGVYSAEHRESFSIAQMVKGADKCLYEAKEAGRNRVVATYITERAELLKVGN